MTPQPTAAARTTTATTGARTGGEAFDPSLTQEMAAARNSRTQLLSNELMVHLGWDQADLLWKAAETVAGKSAEVLLGWHHLLAMQPAEQEQTLAKVPWGCNLLIVLEEHERPLMARINAAIEEVDPDGVYLLVLKKEDEALFPALLF